MGSKALSANIYQVESLDDVISAIKDYHARNNGNARPGLALPVIDLEFMNNYTGRVFLMHHPAPSAGESSRITLSIVGHGPQDKGDNVWRCWIFNDIATAWAHCRGEGWAEELQDHDALRYAIYPISVTFNRQGEVKTLPNGYPELFRR